MSYPKFKNYINTLRGLLKRKKSWLLEEAAMLSGLCLDYSSKLQLSESDRKTLCLAAYFKNLGAIYISDYLLDQEFSNHGEMLSSLDIWFVESRQLAQGAGLTEVATILDQYHRRIVPAHDLAKIFQVLNVWVACQQRKGWGQAMTPHEARVVLEQRAHMHWSDPATVYTFILKNALGNREAAAFQLVDLANPSQSYSQRRGHLSDSA
jgi:hypothetical protein